MKSCTRCGKSKELSAFNRRAKSNDGLQPECRDCQSARFSESYKAKPSHYSQRTAAHKLKIKAYVDEAKDVPCADCGGRYPIVCMDFDHLGDKEFGISVAVQRGYGLQRIQEEIAKCEVVCANCHRIRTRDRRTSPDSVTGKHATL